MSDPIAKAERGKRAAGVTHDPAFVQACERFVSWLDERVTSAGRGNNVDRLEVEPASTFWLGRLAAEEEILASDMGDRAERLDPCAIGIRIRPVGPPPWALCARVQLRAWLKVDRDHATDPEHRWQRTGPVDEVIQIELTSPRQPTTWGAAPLAKALTELGADGLRAEVRIEVETRLGVPELVLQLVNTSPAKKAGLADTHLYETSLEISGVATEPFLLEALPDTFRYERRVDAYGINVGVEASESKEETTFRTTDVATVQTQRPIYWNSAQPEPDLTFETLAADPIGPLQELLQALEEWNADRWSNSSLQGRAVRGGWTAELMAEATIAAGEAAEEQLRLSRGLTLLRDDPQIRRSFQLMNRAIAYSSRGHYDRWRAFQIGFLLNALNFLAEPASENEIVDTVWFATGGGKTETYLGLLVTTAFHDRLTGKTTGISAWSRFPLRLLSLQQTQRFADALAGAERVRREERIGGDPFSLGFFVGSGGTPNRVVKDSDGDNPDPDSDGMPDRYQVLLHCPFCLRDDRLQMRFDRRFWRLVHECLNDDCPWPERSLPMYVVDQEIFRFLPTVVLGTLDKAASIGMQAAMRGLVGPPLNVCTEQGHGNTYAPRRDRPNGCLVPDCPGGKTGLPMARARYAPSLRLQDELHLLRDSLGAVDSHYESLLDHLQQELGGHKPKVVASSATLTGHDRQIAVLYRRRGRVFPAQGPSIDESFWTAQTREPMRRFVAVAPRGVTLEHVSDRTVSVLQEAVRELVHDPLGVSATVGIDPKFADDLINIYGTDVIYGTSLYDVEAAERSLPSNSTAGAINSVQLTGQTDFEDVRTILDSLEDPPDGFDDRIHVVAASSMLSHGVDVARLNVMTMLGLPLSTAEFIQTTARVGRRWPGLVYVLHKIGRERDAQTFRQFQQYVTHGDRFVEPIPITRRSRRVLRLTMPGIVEARRLHIQEPLSPGQRLTTVNALREYVKAVGVTPGSETETITAALGFTGPVDELLQEEIRIWLAAWFANLEDPASGIKWPNRLGRDSPMRSLRDVETSAPIHD
jgi:hypothetical protein